MNYTRKNSSLNQIWPIPRVCWMPAPPGRGLLCMRVCRAAPVFCGAVCVGVISYSHMATLVISTTIAAVCITYDLPPRLPLLAIMP